MYAVDHGARVINLSVGGPATSATEQRALAYAAQRNVLIVAAVGNEYTMGNPIEYPAALLNRRTARPSLARRALIAWNGAPGQVFSSTAYT